MKQAVAFGFTGERIQALGALCARQGVRLRIAAPDQGGQTLAALFGAAPEKKVPPTVIREELLIMTGMDQKELSAFLDGWKALGMAPVRLKAMVTPVNALWTAERLRREIGAEAEAMGG